MARFLALPSLVGVLLIFLTVVACGGEPAQSGRVATARVAESSPAPDLPTSDEAARLIAESAEFGDFQFTNASVSIPMTRKWGQDPRPKDFPSVSPPYMQMVYWDVMRELEAGGWIRFDAEDNLILKEKAEGDGRFLVRPSGFLDIVPIARKEFGGVSSVAASEEKVVADFVWRWIPNEIGAVLPAHYHERFESDHFARATLLSTRGSWQVLLIEEVSREDDPGAGVDDRPSGG